MRGLGRANGAAVWGRSQEGLAERAALNRTYVSGIERRSINIRLDSMAKLASALEVHAAQFLNTVGGEELLPVTCLDLRAEVARHLQEIRRPVGFSREPLAKLLDSIERMSTRRTRRCQFIA